MIKIKTYNKNIFLIIYILLFFTQNIFAQCEPSSSEELNINNVRATIFNGGIFWNYNHNVLIGGGYELPKVDPSSEITPIYPFFRGALWVSAINENNELMISTEGVGSSEFDFFPGPVNSSTGEVDVTTCSVFNRLWEVEKTIIQNHLNNVSNGLPLQITDIDEKILLWPAKGNNHFTDYMITEDLAPFVDLNNNGIYDPENGDYPNINGDQAVFWVVNDIGGNYSSNIGEPLGIEVQFLAYAYSDTNSYLNNSTFYDVKIIKKTQGEANELYFSLFIDPDLGDYQDDYIGCDTSTHTAYTYNASPCDALYGCAPNIPILNTTFLDKPMTSFVYPNFCPAPYEDNYLRNLQLGLSKCGLPFFLGSNGVSGCGLTAEPTKFLYTGNPSICEQWSEVSPDPTACLCPPIPTSDRIYIQSSGPYNLSFADSLKFTFVATGIFPDIYDGLPDIDLVLLPSVQNFLQLYNDSLVFGNQYDFEPPTSISNLEANAIKIYPNPASDIVKIDFANALNSNLEIIDIQGRKILERAITHNEKNIEINIKDFPSGVYIFSFEINGQLLNYKLVK